MSADRVTEQPRNLEHGPSITPLIQRSSERWSKTELCLWTAMFDLIGISAIPVSLRFIHAGQDMLLAALAAGAGASYISRKQR